VQLQHVDPPRPAPRPEGDHAKEEHKKDDDNRGRGQWR
jgi:hypothetical protein